MEEWLRGWTTSKTGRNLFRYMESPKKEKNAVNDLSRKDQSTILHTRMQHIALNNYLIGAHTTSSCSLCEHPEETIDHHLFYCDPLADLTRQFPPLAKQNLLYGNARQLQNTGKYHNMALGRRANVQTAAG